MKRFALLYLYLLMTLPIFANTPKDGFIVEKDGTYGVFDKMGNEIVPCMYTKIE